MPTKVLVVEDQRLVRQCVERVLATDPEMEIAGPQPPHRAGNGHRAPDEASDERAATPDLTITGTFRRSRTWSRSLDER